MVPGSRRLPRWLPGVLVGVASGIGLAVALDAIGAPFGGVLGAAFGALLGIVVASRPQRCSSGAAEPSDRSSGGRALLWLVAGFAVLALVIVAIAPELLDAAPAAAGQVMVVVLAAGVPGLLAVGLLAARRRVVDHEPEG